MLDRTHLGNFYQLYLKIFSLYILQVFCHQNVQDLTDFLNKKIQSRVTTADIPQVPNKEFLQITITYLVGPGDI